MAWTIGANDVANAMGTSVGLGRAHASRCAIIVAGDLRVWRRDAGRRLRDEHDSKRHRRPSRRVGSGPNGDGRRDDVLPPRCCALAQPCDVRRLARVDHAQHRGCRRRFRRHCGRPRRRRLGDGWAASPSSWVVSPRHGRDCSAMGSSYSSRRTILTAPDPVAMRSERWGTYPGLPHHRHPRAKRDVQGPEAAPTRPLR